MANFEDFPVTAGSNAEDIYTQITDYLLGDTYSVEVLSDDNSVILRVWYEEHCDITLHTKL